ncbi:SDR family NAD(P)-dependent oxidoreductase [Salinisphaera sp.]|uniref:SDR family NAD(P)-dependent oxidoreductase n=1 Tax=Salinisphaera sp. TaxID=1914330 RepID=UPI002D76644C|nr:SDR family NAD(P)-dependent oxidoreductase [Salinisphaera sp.]HET7313156.1 SDR family NAD(P)-dependent oxidoreductase [Salinisphaera sp.]
MSGSSPGIGNENVTLITGASQGIGYSLARQLARRGEAVAVLARRRPELDELVARIRADGGRAMAVAADVTDRTALTAAVDRVRAEFGPVTRLVANAGGGTPTHVSAYDAETIERTIRLNLIGTANAVGAVIDDMLARRQGHLVAMGSLAAMRGLPTAAAYSAAKAGVANFMESLAIDLRGSGVDVTLLEPGFIARPGARKRRLRMPMEAATERMAAAILARRRRWRGPSSLVVAAGILRLLPFSLYSRVLANQGRPADA